MPVTRGVDFVLNVKGDADRKIAGLATASTAYAVAGKKAESTTAGLTKQIGGLKEAAEKLQLGTLSRGIGMVQGAMAAVANPAGAATVAIGGLAVASVAGAAALGKLVMSTKAWHDELMKAGQAESLLSADEIANVERMQRGFSDLGIEMKRLAVIVGADLAPAVVRIVEQMVGWLEASEALVKRIDWTQFFGGMVLGFANVEGKISGLITLSESWLKILQKIGVLGPAVTAAFQVDPNKRKMGDMAGPLAEGVKVPPRTPGSATKPRDRSGDVQIDMSEEEAALEVEREQLKVAGAALAAHYRAQDVLMQIGAGQEAMISAIRSASGGMIMSLVKGAIELATNMGDSLQKAKAWLMGLLPGIGAGIEKALTKVLPTILSKLPKLIMGALNLPFVILRAIVNAVPALIQGIFAAFLKAVTRILEFFKGGSDKNILTGEKEKWFGTSFKKGELSFLGFGNQYDRDTDGERTDRAGRNRDRVRNLGSRMTGGYIDRTGRYLLHAGERVVPPTGASTSAAMSAMRGGKGGGNVTVNIGTAVGMDARELARWIRRELGDYGTGASLTPRGA